MFSSLFANIYMICFPVTETPQHYENTTHQRQRGPNCYC